MIVEWPLDLNYVSFTQALRIRKAASMGGLTGVCLLYIAPKNCCLVHC